MKLMNKKLIYACIYAIIFCLFAVSRTQIALPLYIQDTITLSLGVLYEATPFVFLGILLSSLVQLYVPQTTIQKILPKNRVGGRAVLSLSGSFLPVCECGNVPLARGLIMKGIRPQDALTFILAAPIINPVTILTTWQAFSATPIVLTARLIAAFLIANFVGWVFDKRKRSELITPQFAHRCEISSQQSDHTQNKHKTTLYTHISRISHNFKDELLALLPALLGGSLLAGLVQTTIPRSWLLHVANEPVLAIIIMIGLAFIVSICANVDAFFALSLSGIFPISAIVAFLVFGPMIDLKMLALLKTTYRAKVLIQLSALVALCSLITGLVVHYGF